MMILSSASSYTVSVIIPCYNHGRYLSRAIESVLAQDHPNHEIIVIDDGSVDDTEYVAKKYDVVKYIYQNNQGLSAARNTGIDCSTGTFLVFLDADDWLFTEALSTNLTYLMEKPDAGFVSGAFTDVSINYGYQVKNNIDKDHYSHLLEQNYIAMHGTVMFRRWVFDTVRYDISLKACEDYDVYLKVARSYPVICHTKQIAVYNRHETNMSGNYPMMLKYTLIVLNKQEEKLQNEHEVDSFNLGLQYWKDHYCINIYANLVKNNQIDLSKKNEQLDTLKKYHKDLYYKYILTKPFMLIKKRLIKRNFNNVLKTMYKAGLHKNFIPAPGRLIMGDLRRITPFSKNFGNERGGSIDRYYIQNYLSRQAPLIRGNVLEIEENEYTSKFDEPTVKRKGILNIGGDNRKVTFIEDFSKSSVLPSDTFDCVVLTHSLQFVFDYRSALNTCFRILKPGGNLLVTVPGISHIKQSKWKKIPSYSFTESLITKALSEIFPVDKVEVETFGNVLVAAAFLFGIGVTELKKEYMDYNDPHYQVVITATALKPS